MDTIGPSLIISATQPKRHNHRKGWSDVKSLTLSICWFSTVGFLNRGSWHQNICHDLWFPLLRDGIQTYPKKLASCYENLFAYSKTSTHIRETCHIRLEMLGAHLHIVFESISNQFPWDCHSQFVKKTRFIPYRQQGLWKKVSEVVGGFNPFEKH